MKMNKVKKFIVISLLTPALFGCGNAKMRNPNFKKTGTQVSLDLFKYKLNNRLSAANTITSDKKLNLSKGFKLNFSSQAKTKYMSEGPVSFTSYTEVSGKMLYDSFNSRFRLDANTKTYTVNNLKNEDSSKDIKEGATYSKQRLYGEDSINGSYIFDLDFKTATKTNFNMTSDILPDAIDSLIFLSTFSESSYSSYSAYIKNDKIFTLVYRESFNTYRTEITYQLIFENGLHILMKEEMYNESNDYKQFITYYMDAKLKPANTHIHKINFDTSQITPNIES